MNTITWDEIKLLEEKDFIELCQKYPLPSSWINKDALEYAFLKLAYMAGNRYLQTGNIKSFKKKYFITSLNK